MAIDSALSRSVDPSPVPSFVVAALDMTGVGWSLRVACQIAVEGRPDAYCRLAVGHGGAHQAGAVEPRVAPLVDAHGPSTGADRDVDGSAAFPPPGDDMSALVWPVPGRLLRSRGQVRSGRMPGPR
jgi:hypothetical protein